MKKWWVVLFLLPVFVMAAEEDGLLLDEDVLLLDEEVLLEERVCQSEVLRVTGKTAHSKEAGQFHAVRAWSRQAKVDYGKKYSWFKAEREEDTGCEEAEGRWRCSVAARACE